MTGKMRVYSRKKRAAWAVTLDNASPLMVEEFKTFEPPWLFPTAAAGGAESHMHVVSASRRTDIPAFHPEWFMNRIRDGLVRVRSPFGGAMHEVSLRAEDVIALVFWTKNATPMLPYLEELRDRGHCFTFLYTINNYPSFLEPGAPEPGLTLKTVEKICKIFPDSIFRWRYDTIVLTGTLDRRWHLRNFEKLCRLLAPYSRECVFSFCDYYKKTIRNMELYAPDFVIPEEVQCKELAQEMAEIAARWDICMASCAHDFLVSGPIGKARCIDPQFLSKVVNTDVRKEALATLKIAPTRKECGCAASRDIGAYDTCGHGCVYCYANARPETARKNLALIRPDCACLDPRALAREVSV